MLLHELNAQNVPRNRIPHSSVNRYSFDNRTLSDVQSQNNKCGPRPNILRTLNSLRPNDLRPSAQFTCTSTSTKFYTQRIFLGLVCISDQRQSVYYTTLAFRRLMSNIVDVPHR